MPSLLIVSGVVGIALIGIGYLAYRMLKRSSGAVPIAGVDEIQRAKMEFLAQQNKQTGSVQPQMAAPAPVNYQETAVLKDQIMTLTDENTKLRNEVTVLQKEKADLSSTKEKLQESAAIIDELKTDNEKLKTDIMEQTRKCSELNKSIERISQELQVAQTQETLGVEVWEKEVAALKAEKEDLLRAKEELENLKRSNVALEDKDNKIVARYNRLAERFVLLRRKVAEQKQSQDDLVGKLQYENELLLGKIKLLEEERRALDDELKDARQKAGKTFGFENLAEVQVQQNELLSQNTVLQTDYDKLKELNEHLLEKEKILQYELTKSRAHSLGLEKVCEGLTEQIDSLNL